MLCTKSFSDTKDKKTSLYGTSFYQRKEPVFQILTSTFLLNPFTSKVIIENQLEMSNHDHLGKIITYASGLDAKTVVWIVKEAREEHRSAIEWLNNNTSEKLNFFLIESKNSERLIFYAKGFSKEDDICSGNNSIIIKESRCIS